MTMQGIQINMVSHIWLTILKAVLIVFGRKGKEGEESFILFPVPNTFLAFHFLFPG